jgi:small subunit ribosomal protein S17
MSKKQLSGKVISNKMTKTIVVRVTREVRHPLLNKLYKVSKNFKAHTEEEVNIGDVVTIEECPKKSSNKAWTLKSIDKKVTKLERQLGGIEV